MDSIFYRITRPIIKFLFNFIYRPKYIGLENIPKSGSFVLAGNHTNNFDCIFLISSTKRTIHFLAKDSLVKGIKKIIFIPMGIIPVNRSIHDKEALKNAKDILNKGKVIGIFPEGTFNKSDKPVLPFKIGAVKMSKDTSSRIVPFVIKGEYKPFKNNLTIQFLNSYYVQNDLTEENEKLMNIISNELTKEGENR